MGLTEWQEIVEVRRAVIAGPPADVVDAARLERHRAAGMTTGAVHRPQRPPLLAVDGALGPTGVEHLAGAAQHRRVDDGVADMRRNDAAGQALDRRWSRRARGCSSRRATDPAWSRHRSPARWCRHPTRSVTPSAWAAARRSLRCSPRSAAAPPVGAYSSPGWVGRTPAGDRAHERLDFDLPPRHPRRGFRRRAGALRWASKARLNTASRIGSSAMSVMHIPVSTSRHRRTFDPSR